MTPLSRTSTTPEMLQSLASSFDDAAGPVDDASPPALLRVRALGPSAEAEVELGVRHLERGGPGALDALEGFVAPADWEVLGLLAYGSARALDAAPGDGTLDAPDQRVRVVHTVARSGACAWSVRIGDQDPQRGAAPDATGAPDGRIDDTCRRALGLPTAPAPASTLQLWATLWLDALLIRTIDPTSGPGAWPAAERLHPVAPAAEAAGLRRGADIGEFIDAARVLARTKPWEQLRRDCAAGRWRVPTVAPGLAEWMDDGMFCRAVLAAWPTIPVLVEALTGRLQPTVLQRVAQALAAWEVT
jgi:hypothetical protein